MVYNSIEASKKLKEERINARVINMHTIKPVDKKAIENSLSSKLLVSIEEHNVIGGLSSAISEYLSSYKGNTSQLSIGIEDFFPKPGDYSFMLKQCGLTPEQIAQNIISSL